jgi:hypothetical protein
VFLRPPDSIVLLGKPSQESDTLIAPDRRGDPLLCGNVELDKTKCEIVGNHDMVGGQPPGLRQADRAHAALLRHDSTKVLRDHRAVCRGSDLSVIGSLVPQAASMAFWSAISSRTASSAASLVTAWHWCVRPSVATLVAWTSRTMPLLVLTIWITAVRATMENNPGAVVGRCSRCMGELHSGVRPGLMFPASSSAVFRVPPGRFLLQILCVTISMDM